jgi:hypothetical protein
MKTASRGDHEPTIGARPNSAATSRTRPVRHPQLASDVELDCSTLARAGNEVSDVHLDRDRSPRGRDSAQARSRQMKEQRVGDASANDDCLLGWLAGRQIDTDDRSKKPVPPDDAVPDEDRHWRLHREAQITRGGLSERRSSDPALTSDVQLPAAAIDSCDQRAVEDRLVLLRTGSIPAVLAIRSVLRAWISTARGRA